MYYAIIDNVYQLGIKFRLRNFKYNYEVKDNGKKTIKYTIK